MLKKRIISVLILLVGVFLGFSVLNPSSNFVPKFLKKDFSLGLDLSGGSHLTYVADTSAIADGEINSSMEALRDVIERRINLFGVGESIVTTQSSTLSGTKENRLSIELPGVTDIEKAIEMIGQTPFLEFKLQAVDNVTDAEEIDLNKLFVATELTGKYLKKSNLVFNPQNSSPEITIEFNAEGSKLFEEITQNNIGKVLAIYLDGQIISAPVIQSAISGGQAQITGQFSPKEAKELVGRLNSGALPVPINLSTTQTIGATLGGDAIEAGVRAGIIGFIAVALFLIVWYRLPGVVAVLALGLYLVITLVLYKLIPVTLTASGIAGFIISIGIAVDANILIFERFREERKSGKPRGEALKDGFLRAWYSIRDANIAALIVSIILFWFGTSLIKGFALTLGLGVFISMLSAITITRILLESLPEGNSRIYKFLFSSGFKS